MLFLKDTSTRHSHAAQGCGSDGIARQPWTTLGRMSSIEEPQERGQVGIQRATCEKINKPAGGEGLGTLS
jgi:hypothetical protein